MTTTNAELIELVNRMRTCTDALHRDVLADSLTAALGSVPEASDDEVKVLESAIGEVHFSQWDDVQKRVMQAVADAVLAAGFRRAPVPADTPSEGEVLVEGSWFKRADLPEVLGNFMRSSAEYAREAKDLLVALTELRPVREADTIALAALTAALTEGERR